MAEQLDTIKRAIDHFGSQAKLADAIGCSQQQISHMLAQRVRVSAEMAVLIHKATGGKVSKAELRPDIFRSAKRRAANEVAA